MKGFIGSVFLAFALCNLHSQGQDVDFLSAEIDVHPIVATRSIEGQVSYTFRTKSGADSLYLDAWNMEFSDILLNEREVPHVYKDGVLSLAAPSMAGSHRLNIRYRCRPKQTVYFIGWDDEVNGNEQIWTQGQGKYSSHWVPSFDDMREKVIYNLRIRTDPKYMVIANGRKVRQEMEGGLKVWEFRMKRPMSSYLLAFAIGSFDSMKEVSGSGTPLEWYYPKGALDQAEITYRYSREAFDFLETEIGRAYPWQDYKQVPLSDFMYAGMENTGATFFSDEYLTDSLAHSDRSYLAVDAHEMAHQWFGNLVTEEDGASHWLHEGFAQYYAYLTQMEILGKESVLWMLYDTARQLQALDEKGEGTALTDPNSNSLVFYEKGAWALIALNDLLGSDDFRNGMKDFLEAFEFGNANISDFLKVMEQRSGRSLNAFRAQWLDADSFPMEWAESYLAGASPSISHFMALRKGGVPEKGISRAWQAFSIPDYRIGLIREFGPEFTETDYELAFMEKDIGIQKALLTTLNPAPSWALVWMESLLEAPSYDLREQALYTLWMGDGDHREKYLSRTKENGSFGSRSFRQLWWMLALFTEGFGTDIQKKAYLESLRSTTASGNPVTIRINAFRMLDQVDALSIRNLQDLIAGTEHHNWQFRIFARRMFDDLLDSNPQKDYWMNIMQGLANENYPYVNRKLETL